MHENLDWFAFATQFFLAIIGGGIVSAILTETWTRKRNYKSVKLEHLAALIRAYHLYIRELNKLSADRREDQLDQHHAVFFAEAKIIGLTGSLREESERLITIAGQMFEIRKSLSTSKEEVDEILAPIFFEFSEIVDSIRLKINL